MVIQKNICNNCGVNKLILSPRLYSVQHANGIKDMKCKQTGYQDYSFNRIKSIPPPKNNCTASEKTRVGIETLILLTKINM